MEISLEDLKKALEDAWHMGYAEGIIKRPGEHDNDVLCLLADILGRYSWTMEGAYRKMTKRIRPFRPRSVLEKWMHETNRTAKELTERCTSTHPDHEFLLGPISGERQFWQAWCSICDKKGIPTGPANPEMSAAHIAAYDEYWAKYPNGLRDE